MAHYYVAYTKNICCKYKAKFYSQVTVFLILINIFCFIIPLILAYNSKGFWIKQYSFREQPIFKFKFQFILILEHKITELFSSSIICTTYTNLDAKNAFSENCSLIKVVERDENNDGKNDRLNFLVHVTNISNVDIMAMHLFLIFDYKISNECIIDEEIMAVVSQVFSQPTGKIDVISELGTHIKEPIQCRTRYSKKYNTSVVYPISKQSDKFNFLKTVLSSYASRSQSVVLTNTYYVSKPKTEIAANEPLVITADIKYTEQIITYKTRFWQLLKWAWIQYFSLLVLFFFLGRKIKKFVFQNRILQTVKMDLSDE